LLTSRSDWAYVEDFCRRLTGKFDNVFVFTIPLYLPKLYPDGKYRVTYEVIGPPGRPNVSVPTHFSKVILTAKGGMPCVVAGQTWTLSYGNSGQGGVQTSLGAFVFPNEPIPDEVPLTQFQVPGAHHAALLTPLNGAQWKWSRKQRV
jgi:endonuclease G